MLKYHARSGRCCVVCDLASKAPSAACDAAVVLGCCVAGSWGIPAALLNPKFLAAASTHGREGVTERTSELPNRIAGNYEQPTSDSQEPGVPPPSFYVAFYDLQHNREKEVMQTLFVARQTGQCEIDLYARRHTGYGKIFSVIAQNIDLIASPAATENTYPILLNEHLRRPRLPLSIVDANVTYSAR